MITDITHIGRPQQGITNGMNQHIGIAMSQQPFLMFQPDTSQPKLASLDQPMDIETKTYTYLHKLSYKTI